MRRLIPALFAVSVFASGCAHIDHRIESAAAAFDDARYDTALVWLADLDDDVGRMPLDDEAYFYYLRGMTAFRLDRRTEALHYLVLAREMVTAHTLTPEGLDRDLLERTFTELIPTTASFEARPAGSPPEGASTAPVTSN